MRFPTCYLGHEEERDKHAECGKDKQRPVPEDIDKPSGDWRCDDRRQLGEEVIQAGIDTHIRIIGHLPKHGEGVGDHRYPEHAEGEHECPERYHAQRLRDSFLGEDDAMHIDKQQDG